MENNLFNDIPFAPDIGPAIRRLREARGLTLEQIADRMEVNKSSLSRLENGKQGYSGVFLAKLAKALDVPVIAIFMEAEGSDVEEGPDIRGTVPLISWVQAGEWQDAIDNEPPGHGERITTTYQARAHTYALRVKGDSMEPKFPEGCIIIVEPEENPAPGQFVIIRQNGGEATFKQLMQDGSTHYLKPLNPRYPILELKPDAVFCGVVKRLEMDV